MSGMSYPSAMQPLCFAVLRGLTPPEVEVDLIDEFIEAVPEHIETDIAAITVQTFTAARAYTIADRLRKRGITVVMGGYHPTFLPREALQHADSVVVGEAEGVWKGVVEDFTRGRLSALYTGSAPQQRENTVYDRSLFAGKKYAPVTPVEFSRGCGMSCEFCSVSSFHNGRHTYRTVRDVIEEIERIETKIIFVIDDNILGNIRQAQRFVRDLIPLKKKWWCQIGIGVARDDGLLDLLAESGCIAVMIGFESLDPDNLRQMNKTANISLGDYASAVRKIKERGIMIYGSFVFGYDHETAATIKGSLQFASENKFFLNNFNTLNPLPGTRLYERLKRENRLLHDAWWLDERFKYGEIMFRPAMMGAPELKQACIEARLAFNSLGGILKRSFDRKANMRSITNLGMFVAANLVARREILIKMKQIQ